MHAVCLGVVRQVSLLWYCGQRGPYHLGPSARSPLNDRLCSISPPSELCRLPRTLELYKVWKAMEWKSWLLYYSVPCLKGLLPSEHLSHWSRLVSSIYILLQDSISSMELSIARRLLYEFVNSVQALYQKQEMTFNVHLLLHTVDSVKNWGPLWAHSTFVFEAMNHMVQKFAKCSNGLALQIARGYLLSSSLRFMELSSPISKVATDYATKILSYRRMKSSFAADCFTVLGKALPVPTQELDSLVQYFSNDYSSISFELFRKARRVVFKSLTLTSTEWLSKTCDNSKVYLSSGDYGEVQGIYFDGSGTCILCVHMFVVKTMAHVEHLKEIVKRRNVIYVDVNAVASKCVYMVVGSKKYVARLSNICEKS